MRIHSESLILTLFLLSVAKIKNIDIANIMEALEIKREVETLSQRLGKTQDYL